MTSLIVCNPNEPELFISTVGPAEVVCFCSIFPATFVETRDHRFEDLDKGLDDLPDWFFNEYPGLHLTIGLAINSLVPGGYIKFTEE